MEDYLCVTHPFSARRPAPRPELPGDDSPRCYSAVGTLRRDPEIPACTWRGFWHPRFRWSRRCERPAAAPLPLFRVRGRGKEGDGLRRRAESGGVIYRGACQRGCWCRCMLLSNGDGEQQVGGGGIIFPKGPLQLLCCDAPSLLIQQGVAVTGGIFLRIS